jgi:hypothetical protein
MSTNARRPDVAGTSATSRRPSRSAVRPDDVKQPVNLTAVDLELPHRRVRVGRKPIDDLEPALHTNVHVVPPQRVGLAPAATAWQVAALDPDAHTATLGPDSCATARRIRIQPSHDNTGPIRRCRAPPIRTAGPGGHRVK